jgi:hypothetical protein
MSVWEGEHIAGQEPCQLFPRQGNPQPALGRVCGVTPDQGPILQHVVIREPVARRDEIEEWLTERAQGFKTDGRRGFEQEHSIETLNCVISGERHLYEPSQIFKLSPSRCERLDDPLGFR